MAKSRQNVKDEEEIRHLTKRVEELVLIVAGSAALDHKGLIDRQKEDELFQKSVMTILHDLKKDNRTLKHEVKTLGDDLENFKAYFKLPTTKKFWVGVVIIIGILIILSRWTSDAYTIIWNALVKYINKNLII